MPERVLITGARAAAAVDLARDFTVLGYEAHLADCARARIARWSRRVAGVHSYPSPVRDPAGFRARITALASQLDARFVVPTCEEVFHLAFADLGPRLFQPAGDLLRTLHDKGAFARLCEEHRLPIPRTRLLAAESDLDEVAARPQDWVLKARFSRFGVSTLVSPTSGDLAQVRSDLGRGWIAQRRVCGQEVSFYAVAHLGKLSAFVAYSSAWRLPGGASLTFDPLTPERSARLLHVAGSLAEATGLTGQFACDVIVDPEGRPWLLECNPRATSGVHLLTGEGRLARAIAEPGEHLLTSDGRPRQLLPAFLSLGLPMAARTGRLSAWSAQLRRAPDVAGAPGDRGPALGAVVDGLGFVAIAARHGVSTAAATTLDIEWNGEDPS